MLTLSVYSKPTGCTACSMTKKKLTDLGIPHELFDITDTTDDTLDALALAAKLQIKEAPVCVVGPPSSVPLVDRQDITVWSGYRPDLLEHFADRLRLALDTTDSTEAVAA